MDFPRYLALPFDGTSSGTKEVTTQSFALQPGSLLKQAASISSLPAAATSGVMQMEAPFMLPPPPGLDLPLPEKTSLDSLPTTACSDDEAANYSETDSVADSSSSALKNLSPVGDSYWQEDADIHDLAIATQRMELLARHGAVRQEQERLEHLRKELAAGLAALSAEPTANAVQPDTLVGHGATRCIMAEQPSASTEVTLMMGNLSSKYTQQSLIEEMDADGFAGTYDFFYLPIDVATKTNRAYAFINLVDAESAKRFQEHFDGRKMRLPNSGKCTTVKVASLQGFQANHAHFANSRVANRGSPHTRPLFLREASTASAPRAQHGAMHRSTMRAAAARAEKYANSAQTMRTTRETKAHAHNTSRSTTFCTYCGVPAGASFQFCVNCRSPFN
eukprot:TRINITY_DN455_c0_g1_i3.p1 TRINITY_DN455_c0_g1~~TRINITY_DN455_c0_g1_i3.p1  ORF type:complete len:391 (+),score=86.90 TRINITY_DN455_c0_g1_i3:91-1263(+)